MALRRKRCTSRSAEAVSAAQAIAQKLRQTRASTEAPERRGLGIGACISIATTDPTSEISLLTAHYAVRFKVPPIEPTGRRAVDYNTQRTPSTRKHSCRFQSDQAIPDSTTRHLRANRVRRSASA